MTLLTTSAKQSYACDGVTRDFPITIACFAATDLQVWLYDVASGTETLLAAGSDYQVVGAIEGTAAVRTSATYPAGKALTLLRQTALTQAVDYVENDPFPAATHERALDLAAARDQDLAEGLSRSLRIGPSDSGHLLLPPAAQRGDRVLLFDSAGNVGVSSSSYSDQSAAVAESAALAAAGASAAALAQAGAEAARDLALAYGAALSGSSASALAIAGGSKTFATQTGKAWVPGQRLRAASTDGSKVMDGEVMAYAAGSLTLDVDYVEGSGSHADWTLSLIGERGPPGAGSTADSVSVVPTGGITATDAQLALQELAGGKVSKSGDAISGTLSVTSAATAVLTLVTSDSGAVQGPLLTLSRLSASPAASDRGGGWRSTFNNSGGGSINAVIVRAVLDDPTAGSEGTSVEWLTYVAGVSAQRMLLGAGLALGGAADPGAGRVNVASDVQVNGTSISPLGRQTVAVPAAAMVPRVTAGAGSSLSETGTNKIALATLDFDPAVAEYAQFLLPMPKSWNRGTIAAQFIWTASATGSVVWSVNAVALSDDDAADAAPGAAQSVADAVTAAGDVMISAEAGPVTIAGTPIEGDLVVIQVSRDAANGADTCGGDARLIALRLFLTVDAATDA